MYPAYIEYDMEEYGGCGKMKFITRKSNKKNNSRNTSRKSNHSKIEKPIRYLDDSKSKYSASIKSSTYRASNV